MKFIGSVVVIGGIAYALGLFLPWWAIVPGAFAGTLLFRQKLLPAFLSGFFGIFLLWTGLAAWIDFTNSGVLSARIAEMLPLKGNTAALLGITGVTGGLLGGLSALSAHFFVTPGRRRGDPQNYYKSKR